MGLPAPPLLLITDRALAGARDPVTIVSAALDAGCRWIMVRDKEASPPERRALIDACVARAEGIGARVVVNGDAEEALAAGANGVHIQMETLRRGGLVRPRPDWLVGVSCHDTGEALAAERAGADYVTLSPVFATASKPGYGPLLGLEGLRAAVRALRVPVIALAGIDDPGRVRACLGAGAAGAAVMGAVMAAEDPRAATAALLSAFDG